MQRPTKILLAIVATLILVISAVFAYTYATSDNDAIQAEPELAQVYEIIIKTPDSSQEYLVDVTDQSLFSDLQILAKSVEFAMEYSEASFGVYINSLNGYTPDQSHFWRLTHNEELSMVGISDLVPAENDVIMFDVDEIGEY